MKYDDNIPYAEVYDRLVEAEVRLARVEDLLTTDNGYDKTHVRVRDLRAVLDGGEPYGVHCHAAGAGPCLAECCPIAGQRPRLCPGASGPRHAPTTRQPG